MELIFKLIKAMVSNEDGTINKSSVQKIKDALLFILIGMAIMLCVLLCMDDEGPAADEGTEVIEDTRA